MIIGKEASDFPIPSLLSKGIVIGVYHLGSIEVPHLQCLGTILKCIEYWMQTHVVTYFFQFIVICISFVSQKIYLNCE